MISITRIHRRSAFTLVELLVVIGMISVLLAILFPALNAARRRANAIRCMSNLHSLGQALTIYTQQSGYYPSCSASAGNVHSPIHVPVWAPRLRALLNGDRRCFYCPARDERRQWLDPPPATAGPAGPAQTGYGYALGEFMPDDQMTPASYGYNAFGAGGSLGLGDGHEVKASVVRISSQMIAITDASDIEYENWMLFPDSSTKGTPGRIHFGGPNVLFCDGHVQWYRAEEVSGSTQDRIAWTRVQLMWNNIGGPVNP